MADAKANVVAAAPALYGGHLIALPAQKYDTPCASRQLGNAGTYLLLLSAIYAPPELRAAEATHEPSPRHPAASGR
jgi:hypothetical protein